MEFFHVKRPDEVIELVRRFPPVGEELVDVSESLSRVLAENVIAPEPLPPFSRATMDGYAVRARDTFGASEGQPSLLKVIGEVRMGEPAGLVVGPGEAVKVSTGAMLPAGADSVVMVEYTQELDPETIEVYRAVAPWENMVKTGEDCEKGELLIRKGHRLRPQDLGLIAGLGISRIRVFRRPVVAIISTGEEIVDINEKPPIGKIRDMNRYCLQGMIKEAGGEAVFIGISRDQFYELLCFSRRGLQIGNCILISGGSSVGTRDMTMKVIQAIEGAEVMVHGISISPGKPTIVARVGEKAIFGLPGHPVSALTVSRIFVVPLIEAMSGLDSSLSHRMRTVKAKISRNLASAQGREDYVRVRLERKEDGLWAHPVLGKSGLISTLVKADGLISISMYQEGIEKGEEVEVMLF